MLTPDLKALLGFMRRQLDRLQAHKHAQVEQAKRTGNAQKAMRVIARLKRHITLNE